MTQPFIIISRPILIRFCGFKSASRVEFSMNVLYNFFKVDKTKNVKIVYYIYGFDWHFKHIIFMVEGDRQGRAARIRGR